MARMEHLIALGLANWIATTIITEGAICAPLRKWVVHHIPRGRYFVRCALCVGTWIAFAEVAVTPWRPLGPGLVGFVLAALVVKAFGHLVLELRPQAWR